MVVRVCYEKKRQVEEIYCFDHIQLFLPACIASVQRAPKVELWRVSGLNALLLDQAYRGKEESSSIIEH